MDSNLTLQILRKADAGGYGILAQTCYDANCALALVKAAEEAQSPAILQLFPVTLKQLGGKFLQFCLDVAHAASVPVSVHLDHAADDEALELAIGLAEKEGIKFDSIMIDASHADTDEENIAIARPYVERCVKMGIAVEVELGRLEGGEAGLREITGGMLTDPRKAETFIKERVRYRRCLDLADNRPRTGALILAPSIGNLHGAYLKPPNFKQEILKDLHARFNGNIPICLHGTDTLSDELFRECIKNGVSKVNVNSWARDPYVERLAKGLQEKPFPEALDDAMDAFKVACHRFFKVLGSAGKA